MRSIDFFCIGTQRAGTTTLFRILNQHPDLFIPEEKEAHFFDKAHIFELGYESYWKTFFSGSDEKKIVATITPSYSFYPQVPERIFSLFGTHPKFIFILRNPAERAWSHYLMQKSKGIEYLDFEEALVKEKSRIELSKYNLSNFSYISRGSYSEQIVRYYKLFPKENFLFLIFERDIVKNLDITMSKVSQFLGVINIKFELDIKENQFLKKRFKGSDLIDNYYVKFLVKTLISSSIKRKKIRQTIKHINSENAPKPSLKKEDRDYILNTYYKEEIPRLSQILDIDLNQYWK